MAGPNGILFSPNQTSDCLRDVMREISMHEISFRSVSPRDMDSLEKWYSMTDELELCHRIQEPGGEGKG